MRIVAGTARGRRLVVPPGDGVRPTGDRVREALFSSLAPLLPGAAVLDAFAGSGALGLEARSRGAERVTLIERDRRALTALQRNVEAVGLGGATVIAGDATRLAATGAIVGAPFDVALLDPPYAFDEATVATLLADLVRSLADGATVVIERATSAPEPHWPHALRPERSRRYGSTTLHRAVLDGAAATDTEGLGP